MSNPDLSRKYPFLKPTTKSGPITPREAIYPKKPMGLYPENYIPNIKDHVARGAITTAGILASTFVVKKVKKDIAPDFTIKNSFPLLTVTILSSYLIDYLKRYEYVPYSI